MTPQLLSRRTDKVVVREHYSTCATRERGQKFYPTLLERVKASDASDGIIVSFAGVEFVSPSFLDETIVRLVEEHPELIERIQVDGLHPIASARLSSALSSRGVVDIRLDS